MKNSTSGFEKNSTSGFENLKIGHVRFWGERIDVHQYDRLPIRLVFFFSACFDLGAVLCYKTILPAAHFESRFWTKLDW